MVMDSSTEASIAKILLDYSEYERLKYIESQYIELRKKEHTFTSNQKGHGSSHLELKPTIESFPEESVDQYGSGSIENSVIPPIVKPEEPSNSSLEPILSYDTFIHKNDQNSIFDEDQLIKLVPKQSILKAKKLLKEFDERGSELTWNSVGTIFIDQKAIPSANIFILFPLLFKKKAILRPGFTDFVQKIYDMGLGDLILPTAPLKTPEVNHIIVPQSNITKEIKDNKNIPWWYIGD